MAVSPATAHWRLGPLTGRYPGSLGPIGLPPTRGSRLPPGGLRRTSLISDHERWRPIRIVIPDYDHSRLAPYLTTDKDDAAEGVHYPLCGWR